MRDPLPRVQRGLAAALRDRRTQLSAAAFVLTALACYLYVLVGNINNYDNIVCTPEGYGTGLRSGRWMLTLLGDTVGHAMGNFNLPLFNGLLGLVFLGLACQFLWRALHLQKPWQCAVLTAITAAWPAAASAMLFSFTVHYYLFAVLLAAVAVWMADRSGWGWLVGAALTLACSIGVYQAYFPLAAALFVLRLRSSASTARLRGRPSPCARCALSGCSRRQWSCISCCCICACASITRRSTAYRGNQQHGKLTLPSCRRCSCAACAASTCCRRPAMPS